MSPSSRSLLSSFGFLRLGLLALTAVNLLLSIVYSLFLADPGASVDYSGWEAIPAVVTPVMAPILVVVLLFDVVMSSVRVADEEGESRARYRMIFRTELLAIAIMLAYWVPYVVSL